MWEVLCLKERDQSRVTLIRELYSELLSVKRSIYDAIDLHDLLNHTLGVVRNIQQSTEYYYYY